MRLPAIARQLDRCDVCGRKIHRKDLVRTQIRYNRPEGNNQFLYSSYSSAFWACTGTDRSTIAPGAHCDDARVRIDLDNTITQINGSQTWSGTGTFRSHTTAVDVSSYSDITVSASVAQVLSWTDHVASASDLTVAMGLCDADGNNKALQRTWTGINSQNRCWFTVAISAIASPLVATGIYVYLTVTPETATDYWYIDDLALEGDKTSPGNFIETAGTAVTNATDIKSMALVKVCDGCFEVLLVESEQYGRPRTEYEDSIPVYPQEV